MVAIKRAEAICVFVCVCIMCECVCVGVRPNPHREGRQLAALSEWHTVMAHTHTLS